MSDEQSMEAGHRWTDRETGEGFILRNVRGVPELETADGYQVGLDYRPSALADELLRVVAELAEARLSHQSSEAVLAMTVARLGGQVEGRPTHRINFLQRVDELREIEAQRDALGKALLNLLLHCDVSSDGETEFERAVIAGRNALREACLLPREEARHE
jgi:hypothetical protein